MIINIGMPTSTWYRILTVFGSVRKGSAHVGS